MSLEDEGDAVRRFYRGLTALRLEMASEIVDDLTKLARAAFTAAEDGARRTGYLAGFDAGKEAAARRCESEKGGAGHGVWMFREYLPREIRALATEAPPKTSDEGQNKC